ncbi:MAG: hypothetical protein A2005_12405 [Desulfuromonadales bacterium GWC2_61_20]|nr:MAG: hypothetical protein A2005_12405 [Desulfuromonadales bacterium GWC2_61_20]HAD03576.1 hypothetical protein [Desulfuromonas sp.]
MNMKKSYGFMLLLILLATLWSSSAVAAVSRDQWNDLIDVTYKFSWYPKKDLRDLIDAKGKEYGGTLDEYRRLLVAELNGGIVPTGPMDPRTLATGKPWRNYLRLALAEFCQYRYSDDPMFLQNARSVIGVLTEKRGQEEIGFWLDLFNVYNRADARQRDPFIQGVYGIWQDVILKMEIEEILLPGDVAKAGFVKSLPYLYENLAYLLIQKAILEQEVPDLYPMAPILLDLNRKLSLEKGYKGMVEQIVARMHGVNSDNLNINFAVAFLEATSRRYEFEEEQSEAKLAEKFRSVRKYHDLSLVWADTSKGKAAVITQYAGFLNYMIRRFSYRDDLLASARFFDNVPAQSADFLDRSIALYESLATPAMRQQGGGPGGFENRDDYLRTMHYLWDASAKLALTMADYYRANRRPDDIVNIFPAERPLLQHSALFDRYASENIDIVPDNAYFLTAYMARQLADLYREQSRFSVSERSAQQTFGFQLRAVEIFPYDIPGILQLAFQSSEDGSVKKYYQHMRPIAQRLRTSRAIASAPAGKGGDFAPLVNLGSKVIPEVIEQGFTLVNAQKRSESTEDGLYRKTVVMARLLASFKGVEPAQTANSALLKLGDVDFSGSGLSKGAPLRDNVPGELGIYVARMEGADEPLPFFRLKNELYASIEHPVHSLLREFFFEIPYLQHQYPALLGSGK